MALFWRVVKRIFGSLFLAIVALVGAPVAGAATVLAGLIFLPLPATIPIPKPNPTSVPTIIFDRYGNQIATLQEYDSNLPFNENQIPAVLKEAVIADEDKNFYHEGGVDLRGTLRAMWSDIRHSGPLQGGSTITQQYVKLAYTNQKRTFLRKVKEAILASQLARRASKNDILYRYLTVVYFGDGSTGAAAAAENYFHLPLNKLNASEAATLAGLIPAPSARAPREHLAIAEGGRELVLKEMYQQDYLTAAQYRAALEQKLALVPAGGTPPKGRTAIYPFQTSPTQYPDFVNYVTTWLEAHFHYSPQQLAAAGLRVQTTLDPTIQNDAYAAVNSTLANSGLAPPTDMALAAVEPQTGFVEAIVGGRNFGHSGPLSQTNLALGGCTPPPGKGAKIEVAATCWTNGMVSGGTEGRQPGSAWKPFVLATAFEQGIQPSAPYQAPDVYTIPGCTVYPGQPATVCQIHNAEGGGNGGYVSLAAATWASINTVYAQVAPQVGCNNVAETARKLGVETAYYATPGSSAPRGVFYNCSAYALGEVGVSPLDMASAYGVFADHGQRAAPTPILEVVNSQGKVLINNIHPLPKTTTALSANVADNVTNVLQGVIQQGTATDAQLGRPAAGKTGTVSNYTDGWFVGYTPTLSAAVWTGDDNGEIPISGNYGATYSAPAWKAFMQAALANVPVTPFTQPAPVVVPKPAAALNAATTTTLPVSPGSPGSIEGTPTGGPYTVPAPVPVAPEPATTAPPTTPPPSTTVPRSTTTTTRRGPPGT